MTHRLRATLALIAVSLLAVTACGGSDDESASGSGSGGGGIVGLGGVSNPVTSWLTAGAASAVSWSGVGSRPSSNDTTTSNRRQRLTIRVANKVGGGKQHGSLS